MIPCAVGGLLVGWLVYRLRMRRVARALRARCDERLEERLEDRSRRVRELLDGFLQTVEGSKLVAEDAIDRRDDPAAARKALETLAVWLGQATDEGRAALDALRRPVGGRD